MKTLTTHRGIGILGFIVMIAIIGAIVYALLFIIQQPVTTRSVRQTESIQSSALSTPALITTSSTVLIMSSSSATTTKPATTSVKKH